MWRSVVFMSGAVLVHVAIGRWVSSPWLMPDLTVLSMALAILRLPGHPFAAAWVAGVCAMVLAAHHPLPTGVAYLASGGLVKWMAGQWDVATRARECAVVGMAHGLLLAILLAAQPSRGGLFVMAGVQIGLTLACLPAARALVDRVGVGVR